jgi:hypothetical protein
MASDARFVTCSDNGLIEIKAARLRLCANAQKQEAS